MENIACANNSQPQVLAEYAQNNDSGYDEAYIEEIYKQENFVLDVPKDPNYIPIPVGTSKTVNPYCSIVRSRVRIDLATEIFPYENLIGNQTEMHYGLRKNALFRIADAAGVRWEESDLLQVSSVSVVYKACASFRGMDGIFTPYYSMSELNIPAEEKKIRDRFLKTAYAYKDAMTPESINLFSKTTPEDWAMAQANIQINILKNSKVQIAETRAKTRLIRTILGLKSGFTESEIREGFVVERVDFKPDKSDPEVKKMFLSAGFNTQLYKLVNHSHVPIDIDSLKGKNTQDNKNVEESPKALTEEQKKILDNEIKHLKMSSMIETETIE